MNDRLEEVVRQHPLEHLVFVDESASNDVRMAALDKIVASLPTDYLESQTDEFVNGQTFAADAGSGLDCKIALLAAMRTPPGRQMAGADFSDEDRMLRSAPVFFVKRGPAEIIASAARSYPLPADAVTLPVPHALMVFEHPIFHVTARDGDISLGVSAVLWGPVQYDFGESIRVVAYSWTRGTGLALEAFSHPSPYSTESSDSAKELLRWVCAASMFVEQRIVVPVEGLAQRQARKRAVAAGIEPAVKVVLLRRVVREGADGGTHVETSYSCQWLVGGHWRNQWYAKAEKHAPRWIAPYIKGPEGKPLKSPAPTVFAVTR